MIDELFAQSIAESTRKRSSFSLMILDIDHFKVVNDTYGHAAGDIALKHVVNVLNINLREYDQVGRYGGEEFVILLASTDPNEAWRAAERVRSAIQFQPAIVSDTVSINLTVSIGIAQFNRNRDTSQNTFFDRADKALYTAKQTGRNRIISAD
jgi:two-component system cell cycle response regulator